MYQVLLRRDAGWDGIFFVGLVTTKVFCRPVCSAKKPQQDHVVFFTSPHQAQQAGFRPCKRCHPLENTVPREPAWVQPLLQKLTQAAGERISEKDLQTLQLEPKRVRRYFQKRYGLTFVAYQRALRMGLARQELQRPHSLMEMSLDYGYESLSGFRNAFGQVFGQPPGKVAYAPCLFSQALETPLGPMVAVADDNALYLLEFIDRRGLENQVTRLQQLTSKPIVPGNNAILEQLRRELRAYFNGLLEAIHLWQPEKGIYFSTYAIYRMCYQVSRFVQKKWSLVHVPQNILADRRLVLKVLQSFPKKRKQEPTFEEIQGKLPTLSAIRIELALAYQKGLQFQSLEECPSG